jgi:hypothetical protein
MAYIHHPGPWQLYVKRPDNVGLNIMEVKNKYMREQSLFEQNNFMIYQQSLLQQKSSGGGSGGAGDAVSIDPTENEFVVNDYIENYFE